MIRLLIYAMLVYLVYRLVKAWGPSLFKSEDGQEQGVVSHQSTELMKDPQCGTYFLKRDGVEVEIEGKRVHFCSHDCLEAFKKTHQPTQGSM